MSIETITPREQSLEAEITALKAENEKLSDLWSAMKAQRDALKLDAARFAYLCDCDYELTLDILAECLGQRDELTQLIDALMDEVAGESK